MFLDCLWEIGYLLIELVNEIPFWLFIPLCFVAPFVLLQVFQHISKTSPWEVVKSLLVGLFFGVVIINLVNFID